MGNPREIVALPSKILCQIGLVCLWGWGIAPAQNTGIGTLDPSHTFHIVLDPNNPVKNPIRIEGLKPYIPAYDTTLLVVDPDSGVIRTLHIDSLVSLIQSQTGNNIYSIDGRLEEDRTVDMDGNTWVFSGTDPVVVTSEGRVGIMTSDPKEGLQIGDRLLLSSGVLDASYLRHNYFYDESVGNLKYAKDGPGAGVGLDNLGQIVFSTIPSGTEGNSVPSHPTRMMINNDGYVGIGTTNPTTHLHLVGDMVTQGIHSMYGTGNAANAYIKATQYTNTKSLEFGKGNANAYIGYDSTYDRITIMNGDLELGGGFLISSDRRLKTGIETLKNPLARFGNLRGVQYYWDTDKFPSRGTHSLLQIGFIAQEVETVFPALVEEDHRGFKMVNYIGFIPFIVEGINIQQKRLVFLEKRVEELERGHKQLSKKYQELEMRLQALESEKK